ncbi:hypothetical protein GTA08_BOTSDO05438 [Neofusicoccum parvum]|nr:hypothetical protein GTA08_BOTSDO05438 [Neofusicoccum parvum]
MAAPFYPGRRLSYNGDLCTVRYVGGVQGTKGEWLGVEWDDPTRGKHDGSHAGVRYFECARKHPNAGSFVRPTRPSDPPLSYVEALKQKYASEPVEDPTLELDIIVIGKPPDHVPVNSAGKVIKISGKEAEEVGFDKIRKKLANLKELRIVLLDTMHVARPISALLDQAAVSVDKLTDVKDVSPKIQELDISRNLFEEWREVASICIQLDSLKRLRADGVRLRNIQLDDNLSSAFAKVTTLGLEDTLLRWEEVAVISSGFPSLTSLTLTNNAFSKLGEDLLPTTITELVIEKNDFRSLEDLRSRQQKNHSSFLKASRMSILRTMQSTTGALSMDSTPHFPDLSLFAFLAILCITTFMLPMARL